MKATNLILLTEDDYNQLAETIANRVIQQLQGNPRRFYRCYGYVTRRMMKDGSDKIQNYYSDLMCKNDGKKYHEVAKST